MKDMHSAFRNNISSHSGNCFGIPEWVLLPFPYHNSQLILCCDFRIFEIKRLIILILTYFKCAYVHVGYNEQPPRNLTTIKENKKMHTLYDNVYLVGNFNISKSHVSIKCLSYKVIIRKPCLKYLQTASLCIEGEQ